MGITIFLISCVYFGYTHVFVDLEGHDLILSGDPDYISIRLFVYGSWFTQ